MHCFGAEQRMGEMGVEQSGYDGGERVILRVYRRAGVLVEDPSEHVRDMKEENKQAGGSVYFTQHALCIMYNPRILPGVSHRLSSCYYLTSHANNKKCSSAQGL